MALMPQVRRLPRSPAGEWTFVEPTSDSEGMKPDACLEGGVSVHPLAGRTPWRDGSRGMRRRVGGKVVGLGWTSDRSGLSLVNQVGTRLYVE